MTLNTDLGLSIRVSMLVYVRLVPGTSWLDQSSPFHSKNRTRVPVIVCPRNPPFLFFPSKSDISDFRSQIGQGYQDVGFEIRRLWRPIWRNRMSADVRIRKKSGKIKGIQGLLNPWSSSPTLRARGGSGDKCYSEGYSQGLGIPFASVEGRPVPWNGRGRRLTELTEGCYSEGYSQGLLGFTKAVTPASLGYALSVFDKNSTLKENWTELSHTVKYH